MFKWLRQVAHNKEVVGLNFTGILIGYKHLNKLNKSSQIGNTTKNRGTKICQN